MYFFSLFLSFLILATCSSSSTPQQTAVLPDPTVQGDFQIVYNTDTKAQGFRAKQCVPYVKNGNPAIFGYGTEWMACYFTNDAQCKQVNVNNPFRIMERQLPIRAPADPGPAFICYLYR